MDISNPKSLWPKIIVVSTGQVQILFCFFFDIDKWLSISICLTGDVQYHDPCQDAKRQQVKIVT